MIRAIADTHAVIWYLSDDQRLPKASRQLIADATTTGDHIGFSAITLIEIVYLIEKGRIKPDSLSLLLASVDQQDAVLFEIPVDRLIAVQMQNVPRSTVPDMPDRIIAATALQYKVPIISRDKKIRLSGLKTIWGK